MEIWLCDHCSKEFNSELEAVNHEKGCLKDMLAQEKEKQKQKEAILKKNEEEKKRRAEEEKKRRDEEAKIGILPLTHTSVWGGPLSWLPTWNSDKELLGYPAYNYSSFLFFGRTFSGWTGASKILINQKKNEVIEVTEAFGYRRRRVVDLDTFDSFEVRGIPNQYLWFLGFPLLPFWLIGIIPLIASYFFKHWLVTMNFGHKSTTNERISLRIVHQDIDKAVEFCEISSGLKSENNDK